MNAATRALDGLITAGLMSSFVQEATRWKIVGRIDELVDIRKRTRSFRDFRDQVANQFEPLNEKTRDLRQGRGFASRSGDGYISVWLTVDQMKILNDAVKKIPGGTADTPIQRGEVLVKIASEWMKSPRTGTVKS